MDVLSFSDCKKSSPAARSNPPTLNTSHPTVSYPVKRPSACFLSATALGAANTGDAKNVSPASMINGVFPVSFIYDPKYADFLDRPPIGFFFQPQGSSCARTFAVTIMVTWPFLAGLPHPNTARPAVIKRIFFINFMF